MVYPHQLLGPPNCDAWREAKDSGNHGELPRFRTGEIFVGNFRGEKVAFFQPGCFGKSWVFTPNHVWDIYLHEWLIFMVNVGKYTIHGPYGFLHPKKTHRKDGSLLVISLQVKMAILCSVAHPYVPASHI